MAQNNTTNLSRLYVGMNQGEVLHVMQYPYSRETFEVDDQVFEVWFYVTNNELLGQTRMVPRNLTPLTFKDCVLIGWGFSYYNYLVKREEVKNKKQQKAKQKDDSGTDDQSQEPVQTNEKKADTKKSSPLNEKDEEMLDEASDQDFNQT